MRPDAVPRRRPRPAPIRAIAEPMPRCAWRADAPTSSAIAGLLRRGCEVRDSRPPFIFTVTVERQQVPGAVVRKFAQHLVADGRDAVSLSSPPRSAPGSGAGPRRRGRYASRSPEPGGRRHLSPSLTAQRVSQRFGQAVGRVVAIRVVDHVVGQVRPQRRRPDARAGRTAL